MRRLIALMIADRAGPINALREMFPRGGFRSSSM
jgi:hypothetical protein